MYIARFIKAHIIVEEIDIPRADSFNKALAVAEKLVLEGEEIEIVYYKA